MTGNTAKSEKPLEINAFLITTKLKPVAIPEEAMQAEFAVSEQWRADGLLEHLFIRVENGALAGAGVVLCVKTLEEAKAKIETLPLAAYFDSVEYMAIEKLY